MTPLRIVDNKRYTDGSDKKHYVNSVDIIEQSVFMNDISYTQNNQFSNSILNSISLPIRHLIDKSIGHVLAQVKPTRRGVRQGEGRGKSDSTLSLSYPLHIKNLQKDFHTCIIRHLPIDTSKNKAISPKRFQLIHPEGSMEVHVASEKLMYKSNGTRGVRPAPNK